MIFLRMLISSAFQPPDARIHAHAHANLPRVKLTQPAVAFRSRDPVRDKPVSGPRGAAAQSDRNHVTNAPPRHATRTAVFSPFLSCALFLGPHHSSGYTGFRVTACRAFPFKIWTFILIHFIFFVSVYLCVPWLGVHRG